MIKKYIYKNCLDNCFVRLFNDALFGVFASTFSNVDVLSFGSFEMNVFFRTWKLLNKLYYWSYIFSLIICNIWVWISSIYYNNSSLNSTDLTGTKPKEEARNHFYLPFRIGSQRDIRTRWNSVKLCTVTIIFTQK